MRNAMGELADITFEDSRWEGIGFQRLAEKALGAVYAELSIPSDWGVSILACGDAKIMELNSDFRNLSKATNVLSWPTFDLAPENPGGEPYKPEKDAFDENVLGDIAISFDTCQREADAGRILLTDHTVHLLMHGCLHLLGFDHETDADAAIMEGLESRLLEKMGIADPYKDD